MEKTITSIFLKNIKHFRCLHLFVLALTASLSASSVFGKDTDRSLTVKVDDKKIILYLPEIDSVDQNTVVARSALSLTSQQQTPVFGAARYTASVETNRKNKTAKLSIIQIEDIKVPQFDDDSLQLRDSLNRTLKDVEWTMPLERFESRIAIGATDTTNNLETAAPKIYYEEKPAILVIIDGEPIWQNVKENTRYKQIVNTPYYIVSDSKENLFYLKGGNWWYRTKELSGNWSNIDSPPKELEKIAESSLSKASSDETDNVLQDLKNPPKIIISTEPAELIVVNGAPDYVPIEGTGLLYVDNTESNLLIDTNSQRFFVLIAGRWFASESIKGPWAYVPPKNLPQDFSKIPDNSSASGVLVSVPDTAEAKRASLEAAVPEIAEVDRNSVTASVVYDGTPSFVTISNTKVRYAKNSNIPVLQIRGRYYAVDNGIWFESANPFGPWAVAISVPDEVQEIPPSAPVYNVRYVYIYDYTPSVVYVGYTSGYYHSYVYDGTVVYGTGYYYRPWYGTVYYAHPFTFGFGVHYNPYTGLWGYPVGISYGWITYGLFVTPMGFWGPAGYLYGYRHGYFHRERHSYYRGYRNGYRNGYTAGRAAGYRAAVGGRFVHSSSYARQSPSIRQVSTFRQSAKPKLQQSISNRSREEKLRRLSDPNWKLNQKDGLRNQERPSATNLDSKINRQPTSSEADRIRAYKERNSVRSSSSINTELKKPESVNTRPNRTEPAADHRLRESSQKRPIERNGSIRTRYDRNSNVRQTQPRTEPKNPPSINRVPERQAPQLQNNQSSRPIRPSTTPQNKPNVKTNADNNKHERYKPNTNSSRSKIRTPFHQSQPNRNRFNAQPRSNPSPKPSSTPHRSPAPRKRDR